MSVLKSMGISTIIAIALFVIGYFIFSYLYDANYDNETNEVIVNNPIIKEKYESENNWVNIPIGSSSSVENDIATVDVHLGNLEKNNPKKYKVIKIIAKVYRKSNNKLIGTAENYYENVELDTYGYWYTKHVRIKLHSFSVGNDFTHTAEVYGIEE